MKTGIELIADERKRQIEKEGWTGEHDAEHVHGELAQAAMCYADPNPNKDPLGSKAPIVLHPSHTTVKWPFSPDWWKPSPDDRIRELVKAGALIAAEVDRLQKIPVQPKFNVGDRVRCTRKDMLVQGVIKAITNDKYIFYGNDTMRIADQDRWELVNSQK